MVHIRTTREIIEEAEGNSPDQKWVQLEDYEVLELTAKEKKE